MAFPLSGAVQEYNNIKEIYDALDAREKCKQIIGEGDHSFYVDIGWRAIKEMLE